ncbi:hypothetical protein OKW96_14990 [Sphingobacterium sp. KU25419]|nr:hypothetical protein OKW96_14990 [Sphingobacterium sp. KU25419]
MEFNFETAKKVFPSILFTKPKGKKLEQNFAEKFKKRNLSTTQKINIQKSLENIIKSQKSIFKYNFPENFETINDY